MNTEIKVDVSGAVAPVPIKVSIKGKDNGYRKVITHDQSFQESIDLPPGEYSIVVSGENGEGGTTDITIDATNSSGNQIHLFESTNK